MDGRPPPRWFPALFGAIAVLFLTFAIANLLEDGLGGAWIPFLAAVLNGGYAATLQVQRQRATAGSDDLS